jgi:gliding motility-associated-like protein
MDQFDKYMKNKLENAEVPFNQAHWQEFKTELSKVSRFKKIKNFSIAAGIIISLSITALLILNNINSESQQTLSTIDTVNTHKVKPEVKLPEENKNSGIIKNINKTQGKTEVVSDGKSDKKEIKTGNIDDNEKSEVTSIENQQKDNNVDETDNSVNVAENNFESPTEEVIESNNENTYSIVYSSNNTCVGTEIQFELINSGNQAIKKIEWSFGDGHISTGEKTSHVYKFSGEYQVLCNVYDKFERKSTVKVPELLVINKLPEAEIVYKNMWEQYDNNKLFYPYTTFTLKAINSEIIAVHWSFGNSLSANGERVNTIFKEKKLYNVNVLITDNNGCSNTKELEVYNNESFDILAPNAFTPNNDGNNDTFYPEAIKEFNVPADIEIKDLSGKIVFKGNKDNYEWNGTYLNTGNPLPEGVYVYRVVTLDVKNVKHTFTGKVNLIR